MGPWNSSITALCDLWGGDGLQWGEDGLHFKRDAGRKVQWVTGRLRDLTAARILDLCKCAINVTINIINRNATTISQLNSKFPPIKKFINNIPLHTPHCARLPKNWNNNFQSTPKSLSLTVPHNSLADRCLDWHGGAPTHTSKHSSAQRHQPIYFNRNIFQYHDISTPRFPNIIISQYQYFAIPSNSVCHWCALLRLHSL